MTIQSGSTDQEPTPARVDSEQLASSAPPLPFGLPLGARVVEPGRTEFRVWAPLRAQVEVHVVAPYERRLPLQRSEFGYHEGLLDVGAGARYWFSLDGTDRPDPASRLQPEGVHGPSEIVAAEFEWHDSQWQGIGLAGLVVYELHVGTFTGEGTFEAIIPRLEELQQLGVTALELLPIAQFPGDRNWGYDGVDLGAAHAAYGGPIGLKRLVDACHAHGMALFLDVVYNHLGPEGNYLSQFGPYFTDRYKTPWGMAVNFDGAHSDHVRWFFIHNALQWIDEFHVDGLRVDAVHAIVDHSAEPFLQDLTTAIRERAAALGRPIVSIAESDLNDPRVITAAEDYGLGFDSQWSDDFHHSLHALLTGEDDGYYRGFGKVSDLASVLVNGYLYTGQHSVYRGRRYGLRPKTRDGSKFVVCAQNHDQIGNRMMGDRLSTMLPVRKLQLTAAVVVLSPFIPMIFMGEEYGEKAPFQYFTSHSDQDLIEAVRRGRLEEFDDFVWKGDPPDPDDTETFRRSKLDWTLIAREEHRSLRDLYRDLLQLRRETPALHALDLQSVEVDANDQRRTLVVRRFQGESHALLAFNFSDNRQTITMPPGDWRLALQRGATVETSRATLAPAGFAVFTA